MNYLDRSPIPVIADHNALAQRALRSVARAALVAARNAGKRHAERHPWKDDLAIDGLLTRSAVSPTTVATTSALQVVRTFFLPSLVPVSAAAAVLSGGMQASFDGATQISLPAVSLPTMGWIAEAASIPVLQGTTSNVTLSPYKIAAIIVLTREMTEAGDAESVMETVLRDNIGASLDAIFLTNAAASAGLSPAGILNGAIAVTPAGAGSGAMVADISALAAAVAPVSGGTRMVIVAAPKQAEAIRLVAVNPPVVLTSAALPDKTIAAIVPSSIATASSTPIISASIETTLHMAAPAAELVASTSTVAAPQRSIFQTDSLALRFVQELSWVKRGAGVAVCSGVNWP
jgi:hypothetical protein